MFISFIEYFNLFCKKNHISLCIENDDISKIQFMNFVLLILSKKNEYYINFEHLKNFNILKDINEIEMFIYNNKLRLLDDFIIINNKILIKSDKFKIILLNNLNNIELFLYYITIEDCLNNYIELFKIYNKFFKSI